MARIRHSAEQIIGKLREAEVLLGQGVKVPEVARQLGVTVQTYYRWRKEYGGLKTDQAKRFKELERENGFEDAVHRAWVAVGERVHRELQRQAAR